MNIPIALVVGFSLGLITTAIAVVLTMRSSMVVPESSSKSFEDTCAAIEEVVPWVVHTKNGTSPA